MPEGLKKKLKAHGVRNPYALMNAAGIMRGSKTVIEGEEEAGKAMGSYLKARRFLKKKGRR